MNTTRIAETHAMTRDQADESLHLIFLARLGILRREAAAEKQIDQIRADLARDTAAQRTILAANEASLSAYILSHPDEFQKPRMRTTPWGRYGLRSSTRTVITDQDALVEWALANGHADVVQTVHRVQVPAVAKRIKAGQDIPGAESAIGEAAEYKLDTAALQAEL